MNRIKVKKEKIPFRIGCTYCNSENLSIQLDITPLGHRPILIIDCNNCFKRYNSLLNT